MNFIFFSYCTILFCYTAGIKAEQSTPASIITSNPLSNSILTNSNELEDIAIKDVISTKSEADINENIVQRFTNIIHEFSSTCESYKYELSAQNYSLAKKNIRINSDDTIISFDNITVSDWNYISSNEYDIGHTIYDWNYVAKGHYIGYLTQLDCDSSTSTIEVVLPSHIKISAAVQLTSQSNNSIENGSISIILKNGFIRYQFANLRNGFNFEDASSKILYSTTETTVKIGSLFRPTIYSKLNDFLNEMKSPLNELFLHQLREKMNENNISLADACSKLTTPKHPINTENPPILNTTLDNLYFINNSFQKTWNNVTINGGPILIQGLSNFSSTKFVLTEIHDNDEQYVDGYKYDSIHKKELFVTIKTNTLKGKVEWKYNLEQNDTSNAINFSFFIDSFQFHYNHFTYKYIGHRQITIHTPRVASHFMNFINVNVSLGEIQIKILQSNSSENSNFVNTFIKEYLKSVLSEHIKNAIVQKITFRPPFSECVY